MHIISQVDHFHEISIAVWERYEKYSKIMPSADIYTLCHSLWGRGWDVGMFSHCPPIRLAITFWFLLDSHYLAVGGCVVANEHRLLTLFVYSVCSVLESSN